MSTTLSVSAVATLLHATTTILDTELSALPEPIARFRPAPGEWSVNEVLGHLIEAEQRGFAGRIRRILAEENHTCLTWDPDQVAVARRDHEKSTEALLQEFAMLRAGSVKFVAQLSEAHLTRVGHHPVVGVLSVNNLLHEWVHHDRNHLQQIMHNLQTWLWPHMGNAQKFTKV